MTLNPVGGGCGNNGDGFEWHNEVTTSGQAEALLDDRFNPGASSGVTCRFEGLLPGDYVVDTIVPDRFCVGSGGMRVEVLGSPDPVEEVSGTWSGSYVEGQNYARHAVTVVDGTITIGFEMVHFIEYIEVAGIQLHYGEQEIPGSPGCFGDGSAGPCPCSNTGLEGRGCQNSIGTGGAVLFATGATSSDTVVLRAFGERATALSVFLQGNASIDPVFYGDGLRCTGGELRRLYTKTASGGEAFAPGPADLSIALRSAQLGVPISPGELRTYQVFYRDGTPSFCPLPQGSTFNVTNSFEIDW